MRISTITKLAYALIAALVAAAGAGLWLASDAARAEARAAARQAEFRQLGQDLADASDLLTNEARRYTIFGDRRHHDAYWREVRETRTRDRVVARLRALGAPAEELALIERAKQNSDALVRTEEEAMAAVAAGNFEAARRLMFDAAYDRNKAVIMEPIAEFQRLMNARTQREAAAAQATARRMALVAQLAVGAMALGFAAVMYLVFSRRVVRPVIALSGAVARLAEGGRLGLEVPGAERRDEIGDLARAVQVLKENGEARLRLEKAAAAERAARDRRQAAMDRHTAAFGGSVSGVMATLGGAAEAMRRAGDAMGDAVRRTRDDAATTAAGAEESARSLAAVAAATEELTASVGEIMRQVSQAAAAAQDAVGRARTTDATVRGLSEAAGQIGEVVRLIADIAGQTNLLALNPTIEAARAGEAGKGFAVVASEVKQLAAQTAKATEQIGAQVTAIQGATEDAVGAVRDVGEAIARMSEVASAIAAAVEQQGTATREIAASVQTVAHQNDGATRSMREVATVAEAAGDSSRAVLSAAGEVAEIATTLRQEVDRFLAAMRDGDGDAAPGSGIGHGETPRRAA
jgi:methyl-accepting chemotaxis protein